MLCSCDDTCFGVSLYSPHKTMTLPTGNYSQWFLREITAAWSLVPGHRTRFIIFPFRSMVVESCSLYAINRQASSLLQRFSQFAHDSISEVYEGWWAGERVRPFWESHLIRRGRSTRWSERSKKSPRCVFASCELHEPTPASLIRHVAKRAFCTVLIRP